MNVDEAMGIASYIAKVCTPTGDGSIDDRKLQVPVVLAAEVQRLRARDEAARAVIEEWRRVQPMPFVIPSQMTRLAIALDALTAAHEEDGRG